MESNTSLDECEVYIQNISVETVWVDKLLVSPVDIFIVTSVVPIFLSLGVFTNFSLLFVFLRNPLLRSETDVYLAHLALADVLFLIMYSAHSFGTFTSLRMLRHEPLNNSLGCTLFNFARGTAYVASIALVTMVTFERYLALCHPIQHLQMRSRRRTYKMVAICWGIGAVFIAVTMPNYAKYTVSCLQWPEDDFYIEFPSKIAFCSYIFKWAECISKPLLNIPWCVATIGNVYMYVRIILALNKRKGANADRKTARASAKAQHVRNQVAKMLVVNGVVFFLCQAPFALIKLIEWVLVFVEDVDNLGAFLREYSFWVTFIPRQINTVVNPLIYYAFNAQYRAAFTEAFGCNRRPRRQSTNSVPTVTRSTAGHTGLSSLAKRNCE